MQTPPYPVTAVILAGGKGRRLHGQDKGLLTFRQTPIIEQLIRQLAPLVTELFINANRNQQRYRTYGYPVISDTLNGFQGPLAGFHAAMLAASTPYILTLPCDAPFIHATYVHRMCQALEQHHADTLLIAHDGQQLQPVHALIPVKLQHALHAYLQAGNRKTRQWLCQHSYQCVDFSDHPELFQNINTPEQLARLAHPEPPQKTPHTSRKHPPLLGFVAWSGTGKTTLLRQLVPQLRQQGIRVGIIKHSHHDFDIDHPGKDSYILRAAGASQTIISSRQRLASIVELPEKHPEPDLQETLSLLRSDLLDIVLVEGFKTADMPRIELHRNALGKPYLYPDDRHIIALATDTPETPALPATIKHLDINQPEQIAQFVLQWLEQNR